MKSAHEYYNERYEGRGKRVWLSEFRPHFFNLVLDPINKFVNSKENILIGFILMSCAIDYLAGFWWGETTETGLGRKAYTTFINEYFLPQNHYNSKGLYDSLRNGLVHTFTIKNKMYELTFNEPDKHLRMGSHGCIILNASNFRDDLFDAAKRYFYDLEIKPELLDKAFMRYERNGFIAWMD